MKRWGANISIATLAAGLFVACGLGHNPDLPISRNDDDSPGSSSSGDGEMMGNSTSGLVVDGGYEGDGESPCPASTQRYGGGGEGGMGGESSQLILHYDPCDKASH